VPMLMHHSERMAISAGGVSASSVQRLQVGVGDGRRIEHHDVARPPLQPRERELVE